MEDGLLFTAPRCHAHRSDFHFLAVFEATAQTVPLVGEAVAFCILTKEIRNLYMTTLYTVFGLLRTLVDLGYAHLEVGLYA